MDNRRLIMMANQIGAFFEAWPDRAEAVAGVAGHLKNFWAPSMRRQLAEHMAASGGGELKEIVRDAVRLLAREAAAAAAKRGDEKPSGR